MKRVAALVAAYSLAAALSLPLTDVPVIDDWAYAYSVEQMLQAHEFRVVQYSCRYNLLQVLWGALFSLPAGLSFAALRFSTLVLGALGVVAFYDLMRRRIEDERLAFWSAALLAFDPLYFRLSLSFMTDVPLVAVVSVAFWLFDRALGSKRSAWLLPGLALAVGGYLVRELAIVAPVAMLLALVAPRRRRFSAAAVALLAVAALAGFALELSWIQAHGATWGLQERTRGLRYLLEVPPSLYAWALMHMLLTTAALVAPLSLATLRARGEVLLALAGGAVLGALALSLDAIPFGAKEVLSPLGLGMTRALMPGGAGISPTGQLIRGLVAVLACVSLAVLLRASASILRAWWGSMTSAGAHAGGGLDAPEIDIAWILFGLGQVAALLVLWLWQDRYDLVLLPPAIWLLALYAHERGWTPNTAVAGVAIFACLSVLGTRDDFALNRSAWAIEAWLREQGVAARDIDGGYILNGWRLYTYPERYAPGFPPERVPFLFSKDQLPYEVSTTAAPGADVLHTETWPRTWLSEPTVHALRRR